MVNGTFYKHVTQIFYNYLMNEEMKWKLLILIWCILPFKVCAWVGMSMPALHVDGCYLKDTHDNIVNLHGFAQTYSPWFNEQGAYWTDYDINGCLSYNQGLIDKILDAGWKANFIRLHMDPYWSNTPGQSVTGENDISAFNYDRFKKYLDEVFVPMAEYAISKGLYVIMRPPGVCPSQIAVGDDYNKYLIKVWGYVSQHTKLKNHPNVMFELANEPVNILGTDGTYGATSQGHFDHLKEYFQAVADTMRANGCDNILWVPGLGYQSLYKGYAVNPVEGKNIGYAVHIYPGWFDEGEGYETFKASWDKNVKPVADFAPIVVTEMDWADEKYNASWGKGYTGVAGGEGFGANFKKITDDSGNVSWLIFTGAEWLAKFTGILPAEGEEYTFLNDPEACPWPTYHWYEDYALVNYPRPDYVYQSHSDNGDSTYTNPLIFADFPDPDVIRVGDVYYMVSTTMHIFPGATILKSYDLVNWEYCCNPLEKIESSSCYNLDGCNRYSHGQWASSLKYHNGTFYLLFTTLDEGSYLLTATDPEGSWVKKKLSDAYYDPGLFFDDDGKIYVVYGINTLRIAELDSDFTKVPGTDQAVFTYTYREGLEGSHLYKINGYYYIYSTYGGWPAFQVALRSSGIYGTYEEKKLLEDDNIHQGALVQTQTGEWWTIMFYDKGAYGRLPNLQPVTWQDNWPVIGVDGKGVTTYKKPDVGRDYSITTLPTNDNFRSYQLGMQWGWNHNPDNSKWSLTARPGFLRLKTVGVVDSFILAQNTLTQRLFGYPDDLEHSYGTIKMNIANMTEGDVAGLAVFQDPYAYIGVKVTNGQKQLVFINSNTQTTGPDVSDSVIYLRAVANYNTSQAGFYYSLDNQTYTKLSSDLDMKYNLSVFTGNKFCLFNFATVQTGGWVDFDWFSTEKEFSENTFFDSTFTSYDVDYLTLTNLVVEEGDSLELLTGSTSGITVNAVYADGHTEDVSIGATYTNSNPDIVKATNGYIIAKANGVATITISYADELGNNLSVALYVNSATFPLTNKLFNPSIYSEGTFDQSTHTLVTGTYGFGGWNYDNGLDFSGYKYLVAQLGADNNCGISFRVFDENSYWSNCALYDFGSSRQVIADLTDMYMNGTTTQMDPGHIYFVGFWSYGNCPIVIDSVFLSNSSEYGTVTAVEGVSDKEPDENELVDVYTILGIKVRSQIKREIATKGLPRGVYIVGREKVLVTDGNTSY
jgi:beta-xylosidase